MKTYNCPSCKNEITAFSELIVGDIEGARLAEIRIRLLCEDCGSLLEITATPSTVEPFHETLDRIIRGPGR